MTNHQWQDIEPKMTGIWREALLSLTSISADCFNGRHQSCPSCGGLDRFRWTDNYANIKDSVAGDGGAICNQCGSGTGIYWLMKLTGMDFCTAVNELGKFINAIPVERRMAIQKEIKSTANRGCYSARVANEKVALVMNKCHQVDRTEFTLFNGIAPDEINLLSNGNETRIMVPVHYITEFPAKNVEPEVAACNIAMIDDKGDVSYLAGKSDQYPCGKLTFGAVSIIGKNKGKSIYLCVDWVDSWHVHHSTGAQVWCCWRPANLDEVARKFKTECISGKLRMACNVNFDELCEAEKNQCQIILPDGHDLIGEAKKMLKAVFNPAKCIDDFFLQEFGKMAVRK